MNTYFKISCRMLSNSWWASWLISNQIFINLLAYLLEIWAMQSNFSLTFTFLSLSYSSSIRLCTRILFFFSQILGLNWLKVLQEWGFQSQMRYFVALMYPLHSTSKYLCPQNALFYNCFDYYNWERYETFLQITIKAMFTIVRSSPSDDCWFLTDKFFTLKSNRW